jgi:hypothetical protein
MTALVILVPIVGVLAWLVRDFLRWVDRLSQEPPQ